MRRYRFVVDYRSGAGVWAAGEIVELDDALAAWLNRDVPGVIVPVDEPAPAARAVEEPPADRMVRRPARKRGAA